MDLATFNWLISPPGQALLAEAMASDFGALAQLRELTRLRSQAPPERAAAAYEIAALRQRAAAKFARAAELYFTREALEQASGEQIASYRAARYCGFGTVADLACGAGGDTLALARAAQVIALDRDPLRLAMAAENARVCGLAARATFVQADLEQTPPPRADAIFFDPARRDQGRRVFALKDYHPPVALLRGWRAATPAIGVKIAPGVSDADLAEWPEAEVEFISVDGELKEAVLWFGPLATPGRRATLLMGAGHEPGAARLEPRADLLVPGQLSMYTAPCTMPVAALEAPAQYIYEPDPAIIRAHMVGKLAQELGAAQIDREIAYLTAERALATPFARCWRVLEWQPFGLKRLRARLRALDAGAVTVKKRGSPIETDVLARQLSSGGARPLVVVLTRVADRPAALICEGPL